MKSCCVSVRERTENSKTPSFSPIGNDTTAFTVALKKRDAERYEFEKNRLTLNREGFEEEKKERERASAERRR